MKAPARMTRRCARRREALRTRSWVRFVVGMVLIVLIVMLATFLGGAG